MLERLGRLHRENRVLLGCLGALILVIAFGLLADQMREGEIDAIDRTLLLALRSSGDLATPIGPVWLEQSVIDLTALGGWTVLTLVTALAIAFLLLRGRVRQAVLVLFAVCGGGLLSNLLKASFERPRPEIVPHLVEVHSLSFPSGHATDSAIVYLTLAAILARSFRERGTRIFIVSAALALVLAIGCTRVFLGVHYPSDVIAGWAVGSAWALLMGIVSSRLQDARQIEQPQQTPS